MAKKILIIDDDPAIVDYLKSLLTDNGYEVETAMDGSEGLEKFRAHKPDLITLDLDMPDVYGVKFMVKLSKEPGYETTPVVVISGLEKYEKAIKNAVAALNKPFEPAELLDILKKTLG
jgi:CheY-like chemotaxis protein